MIFNPLFITENSNGKFLTANQNKLAGNKYLFSDIVKVVMNPAKDQKVGISENVEGLVEDNLNLAIQGDQKTVQLKLKFLLDADTELAKQNLAEILPADIAQLLINEDVVVGDEKVVSYISKEPLKGELKQFVNSMIGADIIAQNINDKSGLLLSLEDEKSAVNLELIQDASTKTENSKITVQTLVVPQKQKLLSLVKQKDASTLNRIKQSLLGNVKTEKGLLTSSEIYDEKSTKPTLSVYSFKHGREEFSSLTKSLKTNVGLQQNLNLLKNSGDANNTEKVPLEKVSFIPSEIKTKDSSSIENTIKSNDLKLVQSKNDTKDYSVSKITIVKKQTSGLELEKTIRKNEVKSVRIPNELRRIDFNNQSIDKNQKLHLFNKNTNVTTQNAVNKSSVKTENIDSEIKNINKTQLQQTNSKVNGVLNNLEYKDNIETGKKIKSNTQNNNSKEANKVANSDINKVTKKNVDLTSIKSEFKEGEKLTKSNIKSIPNKKSNQNVKENSKVELKELENINSKKNLFVNKSVKDNNIKNDNNIDEKVNKKFSETIKQEVNQNTKLSRSINYEDTKITSEKSTQNNVIKQEANQEVKLSKSTNYDNSKISTEKTIQNNVVKEEVSPSKSDSKQNDILLKNDYIKSSETSKIASKQAVGVERKSSEQVEKNKKVSVKVKNGVKSVSKHGESSMRNFDVQQPSENSFNQNTESHEENLKNPFKNSVTGSTFTKGKTKESHFHHILGKEGIFTNDLSSKTQKISHEQSIQVVRSAEVIKEISKFISKQEKGSLSFDIHPEHLGKMKITLDTADHVMRAKIEVDNEQSKQLIEKNIVKLHEELKDSGVQLNSLNISLGYSKQQNKNDTEEKINNKMEDFQDNDQVGEVKEESQKKSLGYNTYEYLA